MKNTKLRAIGLGFTSLLALPASAAIMYHDFGAFDESEASTGIISSTVTQLDTRTNQAAGRLIRWTDINPGEDGVITFTMDTTWDGSNANIGYLNAMRLEAIPEPSTALLGGLGLLALLRRRR